MSNLYSDDAEIMAGIDVPWDKLEGRTVLISGANGYVPSYFVHTFMKRNDLFNTKIKVVALCRSEARAMERFGDYAGRIDFELLLQDVCEPILSGNADYIIHAASPASQSSRYINHVDTYEVNTLGCHNLLEFAREHKCAGFLLVSSGDIYGSTASEDPLQRFPEDFMGYLDILNPRNAYALGKRGAETLCACYHAQYGTPAVIARPFQIMGPGISLNDGRLHIDFISQMLASNRIVLKSDGSALRSFTYITDAVSGMLFAMLKGTPCEAYNVVDENGEASVRELAELMSSLCADKQISIEFDISQRGTPAVKNAPAATLGRSDKLRGLGWNPRYTLEQCASRMLRAYGL